jgi:hypothetical protein
VNDVKLLNRLLWSLNIVLGAAIVLFSFQYLLRPSDAKEDMQDWKPEDDSPAPIVKTQNLGDGPLATLVNPVEKLLKGGGTWSNDPPFKAALKGTLPSEKDPKSAVAFIRSSGRNADLVAYVGEEILHEGKPFDEFRGWALESVSKDRATFINKKGERVNLAIDQTITPPPAAGPGLPGTANASNKNARIGQPYTSDTYKSRLLASADSRQVWGMDQDEIDWAAQNLQQILDQDMQVSPYAGGGLRIEGVNAGSIGAVRGLLVGDVIREVNGLPLNNISDARTMMNNQGVKSQTGLRLTLDRAGKPMVIEYRPLPR